MKKEEYKEFARKSRYAKGKKLGKKELIQVYEGIEAMEKLGIFNKPKFDINRKALDKHW